MPWKGYCKCRAEEREKGARRVSVWQDQAFLIALVTSSRDGAVPATIVSLESLALSSIFSRSASMLWGMSPNLACKS